jgi:hypothetical protein
MVGEPEALPQEVVDEQARLDLGLASHPVHGASDAPPKGRHLHPFDWIDTSARLLASRPDTANAWPVVVARLHMHHWAAKDETSRLSARRMGWGNGEEYSGRADMAGIPSRPVTVQRLASGADIRLCRALR